MAHNLFDGCYSAVKEYYRKAASMTSEISPTVESALKQPYNLSEELKQHIRSSIKGIGSQGGLTKVLYPSSMVPLIDELFQYGTPISVAFGTSNCIVEAVSNALPANTIAYFFENQPTVYQDLSELIGNNSKYGVCNHNWKQYVGLTQVYDYCEKCNEKKGNL